MSTSRRAFPTISYRHLIKVSMLLGGCVYLSGVAFANNSITPTAPGITLMGLTGDVTTGYGDMLLPFFGQPTNFIYIDPQGLFHNNDDYSASIGIGGRRLTDKEGIMGAYIFGDYNHAPDGHAFWFISPGVERLGNTVDFSANMYLPVGSQKVNTGTVFGDQIGNFSEVSFSGHTEYDGLFNTAESVGIGGDAEVGIRLPVQNNTKLYLGGYYFDPQDTHSITGGTARLEIPFTDHVNVLVSEGYDNLNYNTVKVGLSYAFAGRHTALNFKNDLADRMVDPIHRNLIAVSGSSTTAQPIVQIASPTGVTGVEMTNISFFLPEGSLNSGATPDGSYENPYIGFNQANVDAGNAAGNNNFYINSGLYVPGSEVDLTDDNIYGRQSYNGSPFVQPAQGDNRPEIEFSGGNGLSIINASPDNIISSLRITGSGTDGIFAANTDGGVTNLTIDNVDVTGFSYGIYAINNNSGTLNLTVNNSMFTDNINGVYGSNGITSSVEPSVFNLNVNNSTFNNNDTGLDIFNASGNFNINVANSNFDNNTTYGIHALEFNVDSSATGTVVVNVIDSTFTNNYIAVSGDLQLENGSGITINVDGSTFENNSMGIYGVNHLSGELDINVTDSTFTSNDSGIYLRQFYPSSSGGTINLDVTNSLFKDNDNGIYTSVQTDDGSQGEVNIVVTDSTFTGNFNGIGAYDNGGSNDINLVVVGSNFDGNTNNGIDAYNGSFDGNVNVTVSDSSFTNNGGYGISVVNDSTSGSISANLTGVSYSNNTLGDDNIVPELFQLPEVSQK